MKKYLFTIVFISLGWISFAQQDPMYTMYMFNKLPLNPAYAGSADQINAVALYRTQWVNFEGAPQTSAFSIHSPIFNEISGVGLSIVHDQLGIADNLHLGLHYAYRIDFGAGRLALGISGEVQRQQMSWGETNPLDQADPNLPTTNDNLFLPNVGAGIYWDAERYFISLSVPRLLENNLDYTANTVNVITTARQRRHYLAMAGFVVDISSEIKFFRANNSNTICFWKLSIKISQ